MTRLFGIAGASLAALAGALVAVPLLFGSQPSASGTVCGGTGSIDGHVVPAGVETSARVAALRTGVDELVLLAVTYRETHWGLAAAGVPEEQALAWLGDLVSNVDRAALSQGGASAALVGRAAGVALGDWADPIPVGDEHALGFAQFLPSTWRAAAAAHPRPGGGAWDPYSPPDALTLAGYYLADLLKAANGDVDTAVRRYGTADFPSALAQLRSTWQTACAADGTAGDPFGGLCRPRTLQAYGAVELFTPDGKHHGIDIACQEGATEFSVTTGVVFDVASGCANGTHDTCGAGYGNHVVVRYHGRVPGDAEDHDYFVIYGHMLTTPLVGRGQQVQPGTALGQQGDSGLSWGSHLHFEVDRDSWRTLNSIDPSVLLAPSISRTAQG
jgi:murein DD-endopeptidase MepM/ murein hydrolase activator NlpD